MPERDSQELSLIPYGSRPLSSALSCGSATPYPYPSNEIARPLHFMYQDRRPLHHPPVREVADTGQRPDRRNLGDEQKISGRKAGVG
jgi:hypothetical protein